MSINVQVSPIPNVNVLVGSSGNLLNLSPQGYTLHSNTHISGGIDEVIHNNLRVQGGQSGEYYHLTQNEYSNNVYQTGDQYISGIKIFGENNSINSSTNSHILGGSDNTIFGGDFATIVGGTLNTANGYASFIGGGDSNTTFDDSFIGGGYNNICSGGFSFVGGGVSNTATEYGSFIGGGGGNTVNGEYCSIVGGISNTVIGYNSIIAGGYSNTISGYESFIGAGYNNIIRADSSFILAGARATILANHNGATILADTQLRDHFSKGEHTCSLDFASGVYISSTLNVSNDVYANNLVYKTGNQTINQLKNFTTRPTVNGTGILLIDELDLSLYALRSEAEEFYQTTAETINETTGLYTLNSETGIFITQSQTGLFYAANNPSGFITGVDLSSYATTGYVTGTSGSLQIQIDKLNGSTGSYVLDSETGSFVTQSQTGAFYTANNPSGFITGVDLSSYATNSGVNDISGSLQNQINSLEGSTGDYVLKSQTGQFYPSYNPSGFITGVNLSNYSTISYSTGISGYLQNQISDLNNATGDYVLQNQTGQFYPSSNPSGFYSPDSSDSIIALSLYI